jgi:uncharacterized protein (TIGR00159 family)
VSAVTLREIVERVQGVFEAFRNSTFGWFVDVVDILILAYLIYQIALLIKGTRAVQMMAGVIFILASYWVAGVLQLTTVQRFVGYLLYWIPFAIIVIFQNTIRRLLTRAGHNPFSARMQAGQADVVVNEVVLAAAALASRREGGLIVIEREQGLRGYTETGITVDSVVSSDVLVSIFQPGSPLHDGAVIIQEGRIRAASCFLPLSSRPGLSRDFGSRHRAAIGLTEETDAICVVISEERGRISVAFEGRLSEDVDRSTLRSFLGQLLEVRPRALESPEPVTEATPRAGP